MRVFFEMTWVLLVRLGSLEVMLALQAVVCSSPVRIQAACLAVAPVSELCFSTTAKRA